ncbi:MAG: translation initiation factor IF-2, partial [Bacillota bacterium]
QRRRRGTTRGSTHTCPVAWGQLADQLGVRATQAIQKLVDMGVMASINQELDPDTAMLLAEEFGASVRFQERPAEQYSDDVLLKEHGEDRPEDMRPRAPVVTVMGHVDHGKTSLLDAIRKTRVAAGEYGGITQHIGASVVERDGRRIVFIDTPGHEAFTQLRARGAQVTDIAVLVVAADDGVMPQTVEALNHARAAGVPVIVAINKIDKPEANPDRVKQQLTEHGLVPEDWGGDTVCVPVSAVQGQGIDDLLEMILLVADLHELKANPKRPAVGTVIESSLDRARGPVGTVLVRAGTLKRGDAFVCGATWGRVRAMFDDRGRQLKEAGPSTPVEVMGFEDVPQAGDRLIVVADEKKAREVAQRRQELARQAQLRSSRTISLQDIYRRAQAGEVRELRVIVKADAQGSLEAVTAALQRLGTAEVSVNVLHGAVGAITQDDVMLASASEGVVLGFNVRPDANARRAAEREGVEIRTYRIIYELIDDVRNALEGLLAPEIREQVIGQAEVRQTFRIPGVGTVAGCYVTDGVVRRGAGVRVLREGKVVYEGRVGSLKRFQDDVREVRQGFECGVGIERFNDIKEGDILEVFVEEEVQRRLEG